MTVLLTSAVALAADSDPAFPYAALAALGAAAGCVVRRMLHAGGHRRENDASPRGRPRSNGHAWLVPGLAIAWPGTAIAVGAHGGRDGMVTLGCYLVAVTVGAWLAGVDADVQRLPNIVTLPAIPASAVLLAACSAMSRDPPAWGRALAGGAALTAAYTVLFAAGARRGRSGIGLGDVKLAASLGQWLAWLGWPVLVWGAYLGLLLSGLVALALLATRRARRDTPLPHGPSMVLGAWLAGSAAPFL